LQRIVAGAGSGSAVSSMSMQLVGAIRIEFSKA
jgi:hypothetical protein